jgi:hypothetical protein
VGAYQAAPRDKSHHTIYLHHIFWLSVNRPS